MENEFEPNYGCPELGPIPSGSYGGSPELGPFHPNLPYGGSPELGPLPPGLPYGGSPELGPILPGSQGWASSSMPESPQREEKKDDSCFIATATLGHQAFLELSTLRQFRDGFIAKTERGQKFIAYYRRIAPDVAAFISDQPLLRWSFRAAFILPALALLRKRTCLLRNVLVYQLFLAGLAWAIIIRGAMSLARWMSSDKASAGL